MGTGSKGFPTPSKRLAKNDPSFQLWCLPSRESVRHRLLSMLGIQDRKQRGQAIFFTNIETIEA